MVYRGLSENGNALFVRDVFLVQGIPWQAIESLESLEEKKHTQVNGIGIRKNNIYSLRIGRKYYLIPWGMLQLIP
jgi:hypothetical protein